MFLLMLLGLGLHVALGEVDIAWGELLGALLTEEVNLHATIVKEVRVPWPLRPWFLAPCSDGWACSCRRGFGIHWQGQAFWESPGGSLVVALAVLLGLALPAWMAAAVGCFAVLLLIGGARRFVSPADLGVWTDDQLRRQRRGDSVAIVRHGRGSADLCVLGMGTLARPAFSGAVLHDAPGVAAVMISRAKCWTCGRLEDLARTMGVPKARLHLEILLLTGLIWAW